MKCSEYFDSYKADISAALASIPSETIDQLADALTAAAKRHIPVYVFGNGGSASLSQHFSCDHTKGVHHDTDLKSNVVSLSSNMALITAIANDYSYDDIFTKQIQYHKQSGIVIAISASGNSPNIVKALQEARGQHITVAFVGFDGGSVVKENLADIIIHVKNDNYGVVEDCHQILMHVLAQHIRSTNAKQDHVVRL